jgi:hypothetical protein
MRLYKQKDTPKPPHNSLDCPPGAPSASPGSPTPFRLKRAAEAVSKQISGHRAMVAQFKEMRLPRPQIFSTKPATTTQTDHSRPLPPKQSKTAKGSGKLQTVPERSPIPKTPTPAISLKQRAASSNLNTNSPSPTRPPRLGFKLEKATPPVHKPSAPRAAAKAPRSFPSPIRSSRQRAVAEPSTSPSTRTSTGANLASVSVASAPAQIDVDEPILFVSCFHSLEEDPESEESEEDLLQTVELTSDFESQVAQIFGVGLGFVSENEVVKRGEIAPPKATPEAMLAPSPEPMSAVVEWWEPEPAVNPAIESDVPLAVKSKDRTDENTPPEQNQVACVPSTHMDRPSPFLATSTVRFDTLLPKTVPYQPLSSTDYEYVASLGQGAFGSIALCIHKQSRRQFAVKIISNVILEEQRIVRALLAEQRIMREASGHPFLLGLLASFHDVHGFYLVSVSLSFLMLGD